MNAIVDKLLDKLTQNDWVFATVVVLAFLGFLYLRNGHEYFEGTSGGAYWDNRKYCDAHPSGRMVIYNELVSCRQIQAFKAVCELDVERDISVDGAKIPCDQFLGKPEAPSPLDSF